MPRDDDQVLPRVPRDTLIGEILEQRERRVYVPAFARSSDEGMGRDFCFRIEIRREAIFVLDYKRQRETYI